MTTQQIADKLVEWSVAVLPALQGTYDAPPEERTGKLPDVAVEVVSIEHTIRDDPRFPHLDVQQRFLTVFVVEAVYVVTPEPAITASQTLYGFEDSLRESIRTDWTLGNRVPSVSPEFSFSNRPPFVEFDDGSRGRAMTLQLAIGDLEEVE